MPFCAKCGTSLSDGAEFCGACGSHATTATAPSAPFTPQSAPLASNIIGALAYLGSVITGIIFLVVAPYNKDQFVRFHAFQSIFLGVAYIVFSMIWGVVFGMFSVAGLGFLWSLIALTGSLIRLAFLLTSLFMMYKAYNNERFLLPIIGPLAASKAAA
jgi:uncharacterized membrane protein